MASSRYPTMPVEPRTVIDPKASTGNVAYMMEANLQEIRPRPRQDGTFSPSHRGQYDPRRPLENYSLDPQPKFYRYPGHGAAATSNYTIRPRSNTTQETRRPLSLIIPSSTSRPSGASDYERPYAPRYPGYYTNDDSDRFLSPASSRPRRRTFSPSIRAGRLVPVNKERSPHGERGGYMTTGGRSRRVYPLSSSGPRPQDIDINDAYSYTNLKEEFLGDTSKHARHPDTRSQKPRPVSLTGLEEYVPQAWREYRHEIRPSASKGQDKLRRDDDPKDRNNASGNEASRAPESHRRHTSKRTPVSLHQERDRPSYRDSQDSSRDEQKYRSYPDDDDVFTIPHIRHPSPRGPRRDSFGHRIVNDQKVGRSDSESSHMLHGGLATAGLASGYSLEQPDRGADREADPRRSHRKARERRSPVYDTGSETDESESDESTRPRHFRASLRPKESLANAKSTARRDPRPSERGKEDAENQKQKSLISSQKGSPDLNQKNDSGTPAPKGILKQPTEKFPEDNNTVREGVAPLKDSNKKGIPPGARWTKISREYVSPAALVGKERFEVRPGFVIVLRVLTRAEIQEYANRSVEIRTENYRRHQREKDTNDSRRYSRNRDSTDSDDEGEDERDDRSRRKPAGSPDSRRQNTSLHS
ncbi:uncharacterized protein CIMG_06755 [Coccidioides immitis RS]|uniref:DUF8035 domain-containing protein n=1 Tax=Coccidioides immitis (strain RS) TaxID=246410 RepID=J3K8U7_COCIM|nr:uncharacterized protein CIMG_06755 [Coccidioides immitis RS]EAS31276.3 hypothetical protein CIMG_06755 [Coccidioides immitis RS]TPX24105.1 hypothetical protein DIZ76_013448 [Coccidioides immitis]